MKKFLFIFLILPFLFSCDEDNNDSYYYNNFANTEWIAEQETPDGYIIDYFNLYLDDDGWFEMIETIEPEYYITYVGAYYEQFPYLTLVIEEAEVFDYGNYYMLDLTVAESKWNFTSTRNNTELISDDGLILYRY
ncbi:hypothetical protein C7377_1421 [Balneicella halophila]|uniref:Uncharacterized protein n=1 Tax=Balneicella halophila TaxID=1537566 RepID=A0A7L4UPP4_BALHA|nr:hypothetical protein [Balneicella halophila]PVX51088.1 hypothetical protein C7377_1421 [Balneicella halophila]